MALTLAPSMLLAQQTVPAVKSPASSRRGTSALSEQALAELLRVASESNKLPADLIAYKADVETEVAVLLRQENGIESVAQLEQVAGTLRWTRAGTYEQHVTGYRSQQLGVSLSMLSAMHEGWLNPVLYGNRLRARVNPSDRSDESSVKSRMNRRRHVADSIVVVHPLAVDRDKYYSYSQGDTVVTLQSGTRRIPIARIHVEPRADVGDSVAVFVGDIDLDVSRGTLVKLRGYFARAGKARHHAFAITIGDAIGFIEFENAEYQGKYWLPSVQRIELQASLPILGDQRAVVRIVTRFPGIAVNDTMLDSATMARADSLRRDVRRRLTYAPDDSVTRFSGWHYGLGALTAGLHSDDFNDVAPDRMRTTGAPRLDITAPQLTDVLHFNRVEGWYAGLGAKLSLRDKAPGVVLRANAGWAFSEKTARGRVSAVRTLGDWEFALRAGRSLDITNDFRNPVDSGQFIPLGSDDSYDYVDRKTVTLGVSRFALQRRAIIRTNYGVADDRYAATTVAHGLFSSDPFLPVRGVDAGGYRRAIVVAEWHPDLNLQAIRPGYNARFSYERGDGTLSYQRTEARALARELYGPFTWVVRGDAGLVTGEAIPPQQLFELGNGDDLPGYAVKQFGGSRAGLLRTQLLYTSHYLNRPIRLTQRWWLPGIAPGASVGVQAGFADAPSAAARASMLRLGVLPDSNGVLMPVSRVTTNVRTTATIGLRFFSGSVFVGAAKVLDHNGPWRFLYSTGRTL